MPRNTFTIVNNNKNVITLHIIGNTFLYTTYTDDTNFFFENVGSIKIY